ncbi:MAG: LPS assembly lipoprotein LptE [Sphingomonadales bacterium]
MRASARSLCALIVASLALAGCGFTPMYAARDDGSSTAAELGSVTVEPVTDRGRSYRLGQMMEHELTERFYRAGAQSVRFRLEMDLEREREGFGFRPDEAVTRVGLRLRARYRLIDVSTDKVVFADTAQAYNSFDVVQSEFATLAAEQDMESRLVDDLGQIIESRLARHLREGEREP